MFTQGLSSLSDNMAFCASSFNISSELVVRNIEQTNLEYGGRTPSGTRVLWPNGNVDPWSGLSVLKSPEPEQPVLEVEGASHHFWTHPSKDNDQQSVVDARLAIRKQVLTWLAIKDESHGI